MSMNENTPAVNTAHNSPSSTPSGNESLKDSPGLSEQAQSRPERVKPSWRTTFLGAGDDVDAKNVSWGAIFAGITTSIAVLIAFSLLGTAIGLGVTDPTSDRPFAGVGTGLAIWAIFTLVLAIAAGGFVTGVLAGRAGFIHGVVTWAGSMIAAAVVVTMTASAALGAVGSVFSTTASAVGSGASSIASVVGDTIEGATDQIAEGLSDVDGQQVQQQTEQILAGTGVPELQPEYLQGQVTEARDEILGAGRALLVNPENYEQILSGLGSSLADRAENISDSVDREAIARSVAANTDLTGPEAEQVVNNIADGIETTTATVQSELSDVDQRIQELQTQVETVVEDARQVADKATNNAAAAAGWAFAGSLIALVIAAFAGLLGARVVGERNVSRKA